MTCLTDSVNPSFTDEPVARSMSLRAALNELGLYVEKPIVTDSIPKPPIYDIVKQLPTHPTLRYDTRPASAVRRVCIHHSAAPADLAISRVAQYHVGADPSRGKDPWPGIGYHFYIKPDGLIYQVNYETTVSYHVYANNRDTIGICVAGNFMNAIPTEYQIESLIWLVAWLCQEFNIPVENVLGHMEYPQNSTACPGNTWLQGQAWKQVVIAGIRGLQDQISDVVEQAKQAVDDALLSISQAWDILAADGEFPVVEWPPDPVDLESGTAANHIAVAVTTLSDWLTEVDGG